MKETQDLQFLWFKKKFYELSGLNLSGYKDSQTKRRILSYIQHKGLNNYVEFYRTLEKDKDLLIEFSNFLTINVSYFYRDVERWDELKDRYLPQLLRHNKTLKIWSAGCSNGCEPYTIVFVLEEYKSDAFFTYSILATDIDSDALKQARDGVYIPEYLKYLNKRLIKEYFTAENGTNFKIKESVKKQIRFEAGNLQKAHYRDNFDLIICRNVVIYFEEDEKTKLYYKFHQALNHGGILFVGGTEVLFQSEEVGFKNLSTGFYQKL